MRFNDWPMAARIWSGIGLTMISFITAAGFGLWQVSRAGAEAEGAVWALIGALALAALVSGAAGWIVAASIVRPFHKAVDATVAIARGQLDGKIKSDTRDELGWLLHELRQMQKSLVGSVTRIRAAADAINSAAGEIAAGSADLSSRTETQAASLQQAAGSMERVTSIVHTCRVQLRPVLMTCIVACVGLVPAAVSTGIGSQVQRPLALVVVGGMLCTPFLVLLVMPVLILALSKRQPQREQYRAPLPGAAS